MTTFPPTRMSPEEYLEMEVPAEYRHEYIGGVAFEWEGGSLDHNTVSFNIVGVVGPQLKRRPWRGAACVQRVRVEATDAALYPDGLIRTDQYRAYHGDPDGLVNPSAIFEVLSPFTETRDRGVKFQLYRLIPECVHYLLFHSDRVCVEHFSRLEANKWSVEFFHQREDVVRLDLYGVSIPLAEIYYDLEFLPDGNAQSN